MKKTRNLSKIGFIFTVLILSLASINASYSMWSETIEMDVSLTTWDEPATISDFVWNDLNQDGIQDYGEKGIPGITVNLYFENDTFLKTTTTDENGYYIFDNLVPGMYYVEFILPDLFYFTAQDSTNEEEDSDADPTTGKTVVFLLSPGNDDTWDAGIWTPYQGCSHGFWKNHKDEWVNYCPDQSLDSVFTFPDELEELASDSLEDALEYGGGSGIVGKAKILLRNAVGSVLNAAHPNVNYPMTLSQVISDVDSALASKDIDIMINLEGILEYYNNLHGSCLCD